MSVSGPLATADCTGLWAAVAVWVTHAAGAAAVLAAQLLGESAGVPALDPGRFTGVAADELRTRALSYYRHIYAAT